MIRGERLVDATKNSRPPERGSITDVRGIRVGHCTDTANATGCTAVICDPNATAGVDVRGAAPGARETALLHPLAQAKWVNAVMLAGGSAFGLDAATGAVKYLEEQGRGLRVGRATIPIVPAAILFDLGMITHMVRPTAEDGYAACCAAGTEFQTGSVGAGTGATIGGLRGRNRSVKGGIGSASVQLTDGATVGALAAVNPSGSVVDPSTGDVIAGPINADASGFEDSVEILLTDPPKDRRFFRNTTLGIVATDAQLDKPGAARLAMAGQDAIAMAIRPSHTSNDGDIVFSLATGVHEATPTPDELHAGALRAMCAAIIDAVESATALGGVLPAREVVKGD